MDNVKSVYTKIIMFVIIMFVCACVCIGLYMHTYILGYNI